MALKRVILYKAIHLDSDLDRRNQTCISWKKKEVEILVESKLKELFKKFSDYQDFNVRAEMKDIAKKFILTRVKISIKTLVEEVKLVVTLEVEFAYGGGNQY